MLSSGIAAGAASAAGRPGALLAPRGRRSISTERGDTRIGASFGAHRQTPLGRVLLLLALVAALGVAAVLLRGGGLPDARSGVASRAPRAARKHLGRPRDGGAGGARTGGARNEARASTAGGAADQAAAGGDAAVLTAAQRDALLALQASVLRLRAENAELLQHARGGDALESTADAPVLLSDDDARVAFLNLLAAERGAEPGPQAHIATTLAASLADVRDEVLPWLQYHTDIGFRSFFILWDGHDEVAAALLRRVRHVTLAPLLPAGAATASAADAARAARFAAFRDNHWQWSNRPGNYELMVKQGFCVNEAIRAKRLIAGLNLTNEWLFHLDVDEAFLPERREGPGARALAAEDALSGLSADVSSARFVNYEAVPEHEDVRSRLREVTLFKAHGRRVDGRVWRTFSDALRPAGHSEWPVFLLYGNGKPAARLSTPSLRQWGPHFFKGGDTPQLPPAGGRHRSLLAVSGGEQALLDASDGALSDDVAVPAVPAGAQRRAHWTEVESDAATVLHFPYARFSDMRAKAARSCALPGAAAAAAAGNRSGVEPCFVMGFDQDVFLAAHAPGTSGDAALLALFRDRVALPRDVRDAQQRTGLLRREHAVAVLLEQHERAISWLRAGGGPPRQLLERAPAAAAAAAAGGAPLPPEKAAELERELAYLAFHM